MKKALSIILAVAMLLALVVGCGGGDIRLRYFEHPQHGLHACR